MHQARVQTRLAAAQDLLARLICIQPRAAADAADAGTSLFAAQHPHEVRPVDDAAAGEVALPQEAAGRVGRGRGVDAKGKAGREHLAPVVELVLQLGDDGREASRVRGGARVLRVEELVHAVEEAAHADAGDKVEGGLLLGLGGRVGVVVEVVVGARKRHGGLDPGDAGDGTGGELGHIVADFVSFYR